MQAILGYRKLRADIGAYECTCFEDLRLFSYQVINRIRKLSAAYRGKDEFFENYIHATILPNLDMIEGFMGELGVQEDVIEFKLRSLKYHFLFIVDSCIYATMINFRRDLNA